MLSLRPSWDFPFRLLFLLLVAAAFDVGVVQAEVPNLLWSTNLNARVFDVDGVTNLYANSGGTLFVLNSAGQVIQSNTICPRGTFARRDASGNYYFAGSFDGPVNFGGVTLTGGWTNNNGHYSAGWPTCFVAKYTNNGSLVWVVSFGSQAEVNNLSGLSIDPSGGIYAGYSSASGHAQVEHLSTSGAVDWIWSSPTGGFPTYYAVIPGGVTASNCSVLVVEQTGQQYAVLNLIDRAGNGTAFGQYPMVWQSRAYTNGLPFFDSAGNIIQAGRCFSPPNPSCSDQLLRKTAAGSDVSQQIIASAAEWVVAREPQGNLYVAGANGMLGNYTDAGALVWSNNFGAFCRAMVIDSSRNRFLSLSDGTVARLQADATPQPPQIISSPISQTLFVGDTTNLSVTASGSTPLCYIWKKNGAVLSGATDSVLAFNPAIAADSGTYVAIVSNSLNTATSAPAIFRVKSVQLYLGSQMLTNGDYLFETPQTLTIRSAFTNGTRYYTLDGSTPSTSSTPAPNGQIQLAHNAIVRAIGYSFDGTQSEEADSITATVHSQHTLTATYSGSGSLLIDPPAGPYANTTTVNVRAVPAPGWSFLFWLGDASGSDPNISLSMEYDRSIIAVFGQNVPSGAAAPSLLWVTNLNAQIFDVDAVTNIYANNGGSVLVVNSSGRLLQSNSICPIPGIARRDSSDNYYFAGCFDGPVNFGGVTLTGGWTNNSGHYSSGYPTCFLAKYSSGGNLLWATSFGYQAYQNKLTGLLIDPSGGVYAGYAAVVHAVVTHFSSGGAQEWSWTEPTGGFPTYYAMRLGGVTASNCCALTFEQTFAEIGVLYRLDRAGNGTALGQYPMPGRSSMCTNGLPLIDDQGNAMQVGRCFTPGNPQCSAQWLRKAAAGTDLWEREISPDADFLLARDGSGSAYAGGTNGMLARYSGNGDLIWSNNFAKPTLAMLNDNSGNRFVSFVDASVARLGDDGIVPSSFAAAPASGGNVQFSLYSPAQKVWQIQASSNLTSWYLLGIVTNGSGGLQFTDPTISQTRVRFYRAVPIL
jgi:hypothetical protein